MRLGRAVVAVALLAVAGLALAWLLGYFDLSASQVRVVAAIARARDVTVAAPLYVAAWVFAIVTMLPVTPLSLLGGAIFGVGRAMILAWSAAVIGSTFAYALGRFLGRAPGRRFLRKHPTLLRLSDRVGVWEIVQLRVLPAAPFGVLDYLAGMAGVPLRVLLLGTGIGILPTMTAYVYAGQQLARGLGGSGAEARRGISIAVAITVTIVLLSLTRVLARAASRYINGGRRAAPPDERR